MNIKRIFSLITLAATAALSASALSHQFTVTLYNHTSKDLTLKSAPKSSNCSVIENTVTNLPASVPALFQCQYDKSKYGKHNDINVIISYAIKGTNSSCTIQIGRKKHHVDWKSAYCNIVSGCKDNLNVDIKGGKRKVSVYFKYKSKNKVHCHKHHEKYHGLPN